MPCLRRRPDGNLCICCAFDGSDISTRALEAAALFARPADEVHALFCYTNETIKEEARCKPIAVETSIRRQLPNFKFCSREIPSAKDIAKMIVEYSDKQVCGIICTGTRHNVEGEKRALGRITDSLIRSSHIPVCVIRPGPSKLKNRKFFVGIDGSPLALKSVEFVLETAGVSDEVMVFTMNADRAKADEHLAEVQSVVAKTATVCPKVEITKFPRMMDITIPENICKLVNEYEGDFLVLSTGWKRRDELGSTTTYCIYHAICNVLVYKNQAFL